MNTVLDKRIIALTSKSGTLLNSSLKSNVSFQFTNLYNKDPSVAYAEVGVVSAEIPVSFYTINESNNTIATDVLFFGGGEMDKITTIPQGNYTATSLITQFKASIQASYEEDIFVIDNTNNTLPIYLELYNAPFSASGTPTLTNGTYTIANLITHITTRIHATNYTNGFIIVNIGSTVLMNLTFDAGTGKLSMNFPANALASYVDVGVSGFPNALLTLLGFPSYLRLNQNASPIVATHPIITHTDIIPSVTLNRSNGCLSISLPSSPTIYSITYTTSPLLKLMGYLANITTVQDETPIIADYPLNLLGINKVYISTDNLLTYNYDSGKQGFSNILATLEVDAPPYSVILYKNTTNTFNILRNNEVNSFTIELKDDVGNFIDFNNIDWNITLALNIYRYIVPSSTSTFSDVLGLGIKPPPKEEIKEPPKKDEPIIKNDLDLLTLRTKNNI
jgi:hypothetical protein